jgi:hypothetical protein
MRSHQPMPPELVERLFVEFKADTHRWAEFVKRELSTDKVEELPGRAAIVHEFVDEKLGPDHDYLDGALIIRIRKSIHGFEC